MLSPLTWEDALSAFKSYKAQTNTSAVSAPVERTVKTGVGAYLSKKFAHEGDTNDIETELLKYRASLNTNRPKYDSSPLNFWSSNQSNFPELSAISKRLLCSPASSAASERLFSKCLDIVRQKKRNRIKTETINSILLTAALSQTCEIGDSDTTTLEYDSDDYEEDERGNTTVQTLVTDEYETEEPATTKAAEADAYKDQGSDYDHTQSSSYQNNNGDDGDEFENSDDDIITLG